MDFIFDYISVNTFWTILFMVHALLAVALLGALSHQAMSVLMPVARAAGASGFTMRFRAVQGTTYASAICLLWIVTFIFGGWILDPGGYNLSIADYQPLFAVWCAGTLTLRIRYSLSAPRRDRELEDFGALVFAVRLVAVDAGWQDRRRHGAAHGGRAAGSYRGPPPV